MNRGLQALLVAVIGAAGVVLFAGSALASTNKHAVPSGVRVAGIRVGGLTPAAATSAVGQAFRKPLTVVVNGEKIQLHPARLAKAYIAPAIARARSAKSGTNVKLVVSVRGAAVREAVAALGRRFDRKPRSASLAFVAGRPRIKPQVDGAKLDQAGARPAGRALADRATRGCRLAVRTREERSRRSPRRAIGAVILINRATNRLTLFHADNQVWRIFPVATGQAIYPTPAGRFDIVVKQVNPWWYPPTYDAWAQGLSPVPPGPDNPLGTRWMGLSAPGVGIHGTDDAELDRLERLPRLHPHAGPRRRVAVRPRARSGTTVFIV